MKIFVSSLLLGAFLDIASTLGIRDLNSSSTFTSLPSTTTSQPSTITSISSSLSLITSSGNASVCATGIGILYSGYTDLALQCYCVTQFLNWVTTTDPPTRTLARTQPIGTTTEIITTGTSTITTVVEAVTTEYNTVTENIYGADGFDYPGSATSPCCSSCTIAAQTVNLFYWPTPAIPSQETSFVSDGYTYVSPSVYLGFTSLSAMDLCGTVGNIYTSTTFSFAPNELSTFGSPIASGYSSTATEDYADGVTTLTFTGIFSSAFPSAINYRDLGQNCSTISGYDYLAGNPLAAGIVTYDPCHPTILLPPQVKSIDPAWANCANNLIGGFYDPPYALTQTGALQEFSSSTAVPTPAQTPQSDQAPSTTTTPPQPTSTPFFPVDQTTQVSTTPKASPPSTLDPASPVESSSTPVAPASSDPADPTMSNPGPVQSASTPTQEIDTLSPSTTQQVPPAIGSQTLNRDSSGITVSGTVRSLDPSGSDVTIPLSEMVPPSQSAIIIGSQTIQAGAPPITISGTILSLQPSGGGVVVNGASTIPVYNFEAEISSLVSAPTVRGSQTLVPGGSPITVDGTTYSLQPTGSNVIVNGVSTIPLSNANSAISSTVDGAIGSAIASIIGTNPTTTVIGGSTFLAEGSSTVPIASATGLSPSAPFQFTGGASRAVMKMEAMSVALIGLLGGCILVM